MAALSLLSTLSSAVLPSTRGLHLPSYAPVSRRASSVRMAMEALLWDCDGVLADTERDGHRVSFNRAFGENKFSFEWDVDEYGRLCEVGGGKERMTHYFNLPANTWPAGFESPTTEDLSKGLPVRACWARDGVGWYLAFEAGAGDVTGHDSGG